MSLHGDHRDYSVDEERQLTLNLRAISREIHRGDWSSAPLNVACLCNLHRRLFGGVRGHAGKHRDRGWGSERLTFGPNRSSHRDDVEQELDRAFDSARRSIASLRANPDDPSYEGSAIHIAVWLHAEIIRIHPFEDGNGRSSRLVMAMVLVALDLRPIPVEAVKQEYREVLNHYYETREFDPVVDLFLRLADSTIEDL